MIRVIDLVGYAAPMMVLLMTRETTSSTGMFNRMSVVILSIVTCLLPVLSPHLMLLADEGYFGRGIYWQAPSL